MSWRKIQNMAYFVGVLKHFLLITVQAQFVRVPVYSPQLALLVDTSLTVIHVVPTP